MIILFLRPAGGPRGCGRAAAPRGGGPSHGRGRTRKGAFVLSSASVAALRRLECVALLMLLNGFVEVVASSLARVERVLGVVSRSVVGLPSGSACAEPDRLPVGHRWYCCSFLHHSRLSVRVHPHRSPPRCCKRPSSRRRSARLKRYLAGFLRCASGVCVPS